LTTTSAVGDGDTARTAFLSLDFVTYIVENCSHDDTVAERAAAPLGRPGGPACRCSTWFLPR